MAANLFKKYFQRSGQVIGKTMSDVILMKGVQGPVRAPRTIFSFNTLDDVSGFATGCDGDSGGLSTVHFDYDTRPEVNGPLGKPGSAKFWGNMSLRVKPGMEGKVRGGWAGFRNRPRPTIFGNMTEDSSAHEYLSLRLRVAGEPQTHNSYYVNIQTDGPISTDLWQHRLFFRKGDGTWEDIYIPFDAFVRTNNGEISADQILMLRERMRSIGISMLAGNSGVEGKYELGIDSIGLVNEEDIHAPSKNYPVREHLD